LSTVPERLIIFDSDGVLVDSEPIASRVLAGALSEIGYPTTAREAIERYTGISLASVLAKIEATWGRPLPADFAATLRQRDIAAFEAELRPIQGVTETLEELDRRGVAKCIASSGSPAKLKVTLGVSGLARAFEPHIFSATMVGRGKPAPDLFLLAATRMGARPQDCIVIEDSVAGITAARAAGMRPFGFIGGGHASPALGAMLREAGAALVFDTMTDLPGMLCRQT
jgi:HAD superfamily hydrolase (TIGR01509 family)